MKLVYLIKKIIPRKLFSFLQPVYHFSFALLAACIYGFPSRKMIVIGVTGTTGKTSSVYLIAKTLTSAGLKVGYTSTAIFNNGQKEWLNDKKMTMIGRFFTQRILYQMKKNECQVAIVETTSEGVRQFRHRFIDYDILAITGLYPEHIESHGSFEKYKHAKGGLFSHLKKTQTKFLNKDKYVVSTNSGLKKIELKRLKKTIIVNLNDKHSDYFSSFWAESKMAIKDINKEIFETETRFDKSFDYRILDSSINGVKISIKDKDLSLKILGEFNAANAMLSYAVSSAIGVDEAKVKIGLESVTGIAGRLESIEEGQDFKVLVDYAFEPNALEKLYEALSIFEYNKIIHVLGSAGGGRDIARRPILGALAGKKADYVIVTNEDPYDDDPQIIIDQVAIGAENQGKKEGKNLFKIVDRRKAIKKSFELAGVGDIVLITGKGSEQAICGPNGEQLTWDDRAVARGLLSS